MQEHSSCLLRIMGYKAPKGGMTMGCRGSGGDLARCFTAAALAFAAGAVLGLLCTYNVILVFLCLFLIGVVVIGLINR